MKPNRLLIAGSVLLATYLNSGSAFSQTADSEKINPDVSGSKGGSQSERSGESDVPLPKGSPSAGTVEKGKSSSTDPSNPNTEGSKKSDSTTTNKSGGDTTKGKDTDQPNQTPEK